MRAAVGHIDLQRVLGSQVRFGEAVSGWVARRREALILGKKVQPGAFPGFQVKVHPLTASMIVPVLYGNELCGILSVARRCPDQDYGPHDLQVLQVFAAAIGLLCRQAVRSQDLRRTMDKLDGLLGHPRASAA